MRRYSSAVYVMALRPSICHKPEFIKTLILGLLQKSHFIRLAMGDGSTISYVLPVLWMSCFRKMGQMGQNQKRRLISLGGGTGREVYRLWLHLVGCCGQGRHAVPSSPQWSSCWSTMAIEWPLWTSQKIQNQTKTRVLFTYFRDRFFLCSND